MNVFRPEKRQNESRQAGTRPDIDEWCVPLREISPELPAIENMASPNIVDGAGPDKIDCALPFQK